MLFWDFLEVEIGWVFVHPLLLRTPLPKILYSFLTKTNTCCHACQRRGMMILVAAIGKILRSFCACGKMGMGRTGNFMDCYWLL
jgi:hypothetical protein